MKAFIILFLIIIGIPFVIIGFVSRFVISMVKAGKGFFDDFWSWVTQ